MNWSLAGRRLMLFLTLMCLLTAITNVLISGDICEGVTPAIGFLYFFVSWRISSEV